MRAFLAGFRYEASLLRRDPAVLFALVALVCMALFALATGAARVTAQRETIVAARADETQRIEELTKDLARIEREGEPPDLEPWRDPRNAAFVGAGGAERVAALAPAPLALVASGQSDLFPGVVRVTSESKDHFLFADEIDNPANLMTGTTDLAFVIVFVFPLVMLALCFNLLSSEREQGTMAMTLAAARSPAATLAGKLAARIAAPIGAMLVAVTGGSVFYTDAGAVATPAFMALVALILLYGLFWAALGAAVDSLGRSSAFNALGLIGAFVTVTMLAPAAINSLASYAYPAPSRLNMVLAARAATTDADKARDAALARYVEEHGEDKSVVRGGAKERTSRRLATLEAAFARVENVVAAHDAQLARQRNLSDRLAFLSPALLVYRATGDLAGTGEARYRDFLARLGAFHMQWRDFFVSRAKADAPMTQGDYAALPRFEEPPAPHFRLAAPLLGVALPTLLLAVFAWRGFRRAVP